MSNLSVTTVPRDLYYNEAAYVRALEAIAVIAHATLKEDDTRLKQAFLNLSNCKRKLFAEDKG